MPDEEEIREDLVAGLLARLEASPADHARFTGPPVDAHALRPLELGRLRAAARRAIARDDENIAALSVAHRILSQPGFLLDEASAVETFRSFDAGDWQLALAHLGHLRDAMTPALQAELHRILDAADIWSGPPLPHPATLHLLARTAAYDPAAGYSVLRQRYAGSLHVLAEAEVLGQLSLSSLEMLARTNGYFSPDDEEDDVAQLLAEEPAYVEFAQRCIEAATRTLEDIHAHRLPYEADGAFTPEDAQVIARAVRVASWRDEAWLREPVVRLLPLACVAPGAAKTVPSQALAHAMSHSIARVPTPETLRALREALAVVRHAGVRKKLERGLKPAERALAARPALALRLGDLPDKKQQAMLAIFLEAGLWQDVHWSANEWRTRLLESAGGKPLAQSLIWRMRPDGGGSGTAFMARPAGKGWTAIDSSGAELPWPADGRIGLWHPLHAQEAQRQAWQARIGTEQLRQPFRQAFREHYLVDPQEASGHRTDSFAGHQLALRTLTGLAVRESWRIERDTGLRRRFGALRATLEVAGRLHAQALGHGSSGSLRFERWQDGGWQPAPLHGIDPVAFSEACRAVDLLVSVSAFADAQPSLPEPAQHERRMRLRHLADLPLGSMAAMRRRALALALGQAIADGRVVLEERHIRIGDHTVHLSTARVTCRGAPVELPLPDKRGKLHPVPWLPYDEVLLQRIADAVGVLLAQASPPSGGT